MLQIISLLVLFVTLFIVTNEIVEWLQKRNRLKSIKNTRQKKMIKEKNGLTALSEKLMFWYPVEVDTKLAQAGYPGLFGKSKGHYFAFKLLFGGLIFYVMGDGLFGILLAVGAFVFCPDFFISQAVKKRQNEIRQELPIMIENLKKSLVRGGQMTETLAILPRRLSGPLKEEVIRLSATYNLTYDLRSSLDEFARRTGLDEVNNLCLALKQSEQTGKVKTLLEQQHESLGVTSFYKDKQNMQSKANLLPLISILIVLNIIILAGMPMFFELLSGDLLL